ncbi:MAG TPA: glycoside hydrolase family 172 protein [Mucilaginibacter sp.]|nr:glycoside hydrolase family 172 protein [Mucilaginibacter sp.]
MFSFRRFSQLLLMFTAVLFAGRVCAQELYIMPQGVQSRVSSFENLNGVKGAGGQTNKTAKGNAFESLLAGQTKSLLNISSAGIIQRMWVTVNDRSPAMLRALRLRMYWDGSDKPAVDVPLGDFFCAGLGRPVAFQSALFSDPEGRSFNSYIPMPFKTGAKVTLTNESRSDLNLLFYDIDYVIMDKPQPGMLYFHAFWNRTIKSTLTKDFELLPAVNGRGRFLGVNVGVNVDAAYGHTWWGEGEVKMYIDGDTDHPTINGTGAEDYIGTGWGEGAFTNQYQGCSIADTTKNQYAFYRFHIPDAIYFNQNFKATIQEIGGGSDAEVKALVTKGVPLKPISVATDNGFTRLLDNPIALTDSKFPKGWINFYRIDDYSATAYFYLDKPVSNLKALAPVEERVK